MKYQLCDDINTVMLSLEILPVKKAVSLTAYDIWLSNGEHDDPSKMLHAEYLTLDMQNCFKDYVHISYHVLDFVQQNKTKFTMELHMLPILYCQYHSC